jgi:hypothetical protein
VSSLGEAKSSLGDAKSSLGDAQSGTTSCVRQLHLLRERVRGELAG